MMAVWVCWLCIKASMALDNQDIWQHYQQRKQPWFDLSGNYDPQRVKRYVEGEIVSCGIWRQYCPKIWNYPGTNHDEWAWQLNRHYHWAELGQAYKATGNRQYAEVFLSQLRDWLATQKRPTDNGDHPCSSWRTLEAGIRAGRTWPVAFYCFLPVIDADTLVRWLRSWREHAQHLVDWPSDSSNWLIEECRGFVAYL